MGKRTISQRKGRGTPTYKAPSRKYKGEVKHPPAEDKTFYGKVIEIVHDPGRNAPIARVQFENGEERLILVPEGMKEGDEVYCGVSASIEPGNTLPLSEIPEGTPICNIEAQHGDGGKFARASGTFGILIAHDVGKTLVQLPSGELRNLNPNARATIGVVAGGGKIEKPMVKAGKKYHACKSKAKKYPRVRGVAMNAVDHPFGGGRHQHPGKPTTVSRGAPPGRKAGRIAAKRIERK